MNNFVFCTPTKVFFGRGIEQSIGENIRAFGAKKVLLHYGGGSVKRNGLLDKVIDSLNAAGLPFVELGGVEPNPKLSLIRKGIALCKSEEVNFLLAVGGGSVIDSAKAIGVGLANNCDPWDFIETKTAPDKCMPVGVVLTLSAAGSEMSNSDVITNDETHLKRGITSEAVRPAVAFLNPENTFTVSKFQTGCGIVDTMMHTLERYFTGDADCDLTDRLAEGLLIAVRDAGRAAIANPEDYNARATLMWASSLSHNDITGCGKNRKFPVHKMEHDISGVHDNVAHGAGLAVLFPAWAEYVLEYDTMKFAQLAHRVWGAEMNFDHPEVTAREGIRAMRAYFHEIGMPITMKELGITPDDYAEIIEKTTLDGTTLSSYLTLGPKEMLDIYRLAE